jgi:hypothetical protein
VVEGEESVEMKEKKRGKMYLLTERVDTREEARHLVEGVMNHPAYIALRDTDLYLSETMRQTLEGKDLQDRSKVLAGNMEKGRALELVA